MQVLFYLKFQVVERGITMERSEKRDLFRFGLKRTEAFTVFMAAGETDLSLLPEPITKTEKQLMELCKEKAAEITAMGEMIRDAFHHEDSEDSTGEDGKGESITKPETPDVTEPTRETVQEEKTVAKKTTKRTSTKKTAAK